jgi:hypothetical protein
VLEERWHDVFVELRRGLGPGRADQRRREARHEATLRDVAQRAQDLEVRFEAQHGARPWHL